MSELEITEVNNVLEVTTPGTPGPAGVGVPPGGDEGDVLSKASGTDYDTEWVDPASVGGAAPDDATYLVTTADPTLSNEVVVGATPGGELGGTWASPTVDATHSGSSHAQVQAAAEATAAAALAAHLADATDAHDASAISIADAGGDFTATDVEGALDELQADAEADAAALAAHLADGADAHDASAISSVAAGNLSSTDVQAALNELDSEKVATGTFNDHSARHENGGADEISIAGLDGTSTELANHLADAADAHDASAVSVVPFGDVEATEVQAALEEIAAMVGGGGPPSGDAGGVLDGTYPDPDLAVGVAGAGLALTGGNVLSVGVDGSTIEINADALRVKAGGITAAHVAADVATQAELDAHTGDTSDAHDASAISVDSTTLSGTATDVQASLEELDNLLDDHSARHENGGADEISIAGLDGVSTELAAHLADAADAHDASAISVVSTTLQTGTGTDVQAVFEEMDDLILDHSARHENGGADEISIAGLSGTSEALQAHLDDTSDAHDASAISVVSTTLSGTGTDVQAVLEELDNLLDDHSSRHENGGADEISIAGLDGTPTELTNHLNDTTDAHDASAISVADSGGYFASSEVEAAMQELGPERVRSVQMVITDPAGSALSTGDGQGAPFVVPTWMNGWDLVAVMAAVTTVSSSGLPTVQIRNETQTADMLTTKCSIDASERTSLTAATAAVIDTGNDDVASGDFIWVDIDVAGTGAKGLIVTLTFKKP